MTRKNNPPGEKQANKSKDPGAIIDVLFHHIASSMLSLAGYATVLSNEYAGKLDRKGRHYVRRIRENVREMEKEVRMLRVYINDKGEKG